MEADDLLCSRNALGLVYLVAGLSGFLNELPVRSTKQTR